MLRSLINYLHILVIAPLIVLLGYVNLPNANRKLVSMVRSRTFSMSLIVVGVVIMLYHSTLILNRSVSTFMMRDNLRLESNQFVGKDAQAEGVEVDAQCDLASFDSLPDPRKENFAARDLPLWGNREGSH